MSRRFRKHQSKTAVSNGLRIADRAFTRILPAAKKYEGSQLERRGTEEERVCIGA